MNSVSNYSTSTDLNTDPIRRTRVYQTTVHKPRNTKRDKRKSAARDLATLDALYAGQPRLIGEW